MWRQYVPSRRRATNNNNNVKNFAIVILVITVGLLLGVIMNLKRANDLHQYALVNDCKWSWQGTNYGDSRDYICK